jgi:translation initiation factor 1
MKKNKDNEPNKRVIYSTNPDFKPEEENVEDFEVPSSEQTLYVSLQRLKEDKIATIISNFEGTDAALQTLGKQLKSQCGVGGTVKDGIILLQGEHREKVIGILSDLGFKTKRKGG